MLISISKKKEQKYQPPIPLEPFSKLALVLVKMGKMEVRSLSFPTGKDASLLWRRRRMRVCILGLVMDVGADLGLGGRW